MLSGLYISVHPSCQVSRPSYQADLRLICPLRTGRLSNCADRRGFGVYYGAREQRLQSHRPPPRTPSAGMRQRRRRAGQQRHPSPAKHWIESAIAIEAKEAPPRKKAWIGTETFFSACANYIHFRKRKKGFCLSGQMFR